MMFSSFGGFSRGVSLFFRALCHQCSVEVCLPGPSLFLLQVRVLGSVLGVVCVLVSRGGWGRVCLWF